MYISVYGALKVRIYNYRLTNTLRVAWNKNVIFLDGPPEGYKTNNVMAI